MPVDLSVHGAEKLGDIARQLRAAGNDELRKELNRGINQATKPLTGVARRSALANLPRRGGLNRFVATSRFRTTTRSGRNPGVRISAAKAGHDVRAIDRGRLRHPLFGVRRHWFTQEVRPGWFSTPMEAGAPGVRREVVRVLDDLARRVAR